MRSNYNKETLNISDKLMRRVSNYDARAFEQLYNQASGAVFGLAMSIVGNQADAEDIVQNTFISIYEKISSYKPQGKAMAWIFTITRNHAYMLLRNKEKHTHIDLDDLYDIGTDNTVVEDTYKENITKLLLSELKDDERQIVTMHAMSNIKHKDIAKIMDMPLSTVLSKYRRSLEKLRNVLEVNEYET
ncbi:MAG: RNA polymerase sigma factor [Candidatus Izemoplasmataceae bacterium]